MLYAFPEKWHQITCNPFSFTAVLSQLCLSSLQLFCHLPFPGGCLLGRSSASQVRGGAVSPEIAMKQGLPEELCWKLSFGIKTRRREC